MTEKTFEPVTFTVSVLQPDRQHFSDVAQFVATVATEQESQERAAYDATAAALDAAWPGQWVYAHGDLSTGNYSGQFQWKDGGWGSYVPATVRVHDPQAIARARAETKKRRATEKRKEADIAKLPPMELKDAALWQKCLDNNRDGYGTAVNQYAEQWARLVQRDLQPYRANGFAPLTEAQLAEIFDRASHEADTMGLTGFQYGAAVATLEGVWVYGAALKAWHNKEWGRPDAEGVVNPALWTINVKEAEGA